MADMASCGASESSCCAEWNLANTLFRSILSQLTNVHFVTVELWRRSNNGLLSDALLKGNSRAPSRQEGKKANTDSWHA